MRIGNDVRKEGDSSLGSPLDHGLAPHQQRVRFQSPEALDSPRTIRVAYSLSDISDINSSSSPPSNYKRWMSGDLTGPGPRISWSVGLTSSNRLISPSASSFFSRMVPLVWNPNDDGRMSSMDTTHGSDDGEFTYWTVESYLAQDAFLQAVTSSSARRMLIIFTPRP